MEQEIVFNKLVTASVMASTAVSADQFLETRRS